MKLTVLTFWKILVVYIVVMKQIFYYAQKITKLLLLKVLKMCMKLIRDLQNQQ